MADYMSMQHTTYHCLESVLAALYRRRAVLDEILQRFGQVPHNRPVGVTTLTFTPKNGRKRNHSTRGEYRIAATNSRKLNRQR